MNMFEYTGSVHIHSVFSDGSGEVTEIVRFARELGLDFIMLTDHNTLRAKEEGFEGFHGNTALIVGCEINDKENCNHYLAFGVDKTISTRVPAKDYVRMIKEAGGIGFLAHPHEKRSSHKEYPPYPWTEWETDDFTGMEIWNHMSEWMENLTEENKYHSFVHPLKSIKMPPQETLETWDRLSQNRRVVGIGGVDAHAHKVNLLGLMEVEVFPYKVLFKSIRTHILLNENYDFSISEQYPRFRDAILNALKNGRTFFANHYLGDAEGFRFAMVSGTTVYYMGDEFRLEKEAEIKVSVPGSAKNMVRVLRNGVLFASSEEGDLSAVITRPGAYRAEVLRGNRGWIFSNHIRVL